ncbi:MAG: hypothetical protein J4F45_13505 [Pseudomonadales bacterium]|nr:hypothetical protein [Pseudomonadales bacterium]
MAKGDPSTLGGRLHAANLLAVVRQLRHSENTQQSIDLSLFLNGIPIFTAELKRPLTGQDAEDAPHDPPGGGLRYASRTNALGSHDDVRPRR